jgi:hypothetical protein
VSGPYPIQQAIRTGFGKEPAFTREGGSIGAVVSMEKAWKVPILFLGLSLPEHGYHALNERFDWRQAAAGHEGVFNVFCGAGEEVMSRLTNGVSKGCCSCSPALLPRRIQRGKQQRTQRAGEQGGEHQAELREMVL